MHVQPRKDGIARRRSQNTVLLGYKIGTGRVPLRLGSSSRSSINVLFPMTGEQLTDAGGPTIGDPNARSSPISTTSEDAKYSTCPAGSLSGVRTAGAAGRGSWLRAIRRSIGPSDGVWQDEDGRSEHGGDLRRPDSPEPGGRIGHPRRYHARPPGCARKPGSTGPKATVLNGHQP